MGALSRRPLDHHDIRIATRVRRREDDLASRTDSMESRMLSVIGRGEFRRYPCCDLGLDRSRNEFKNLEKFRGCSIFFGANAWSKYNLCPTR
jgi:hypothetical protein